MKRRSQCGHDSVGYRDGYPQRERPKTEPRMWLLRSACPEEQRPARDTGSNAVY